MDYARGENIGMPSNDEITIFSVHHHPLVLFWPIFAELLCSIAWIALLLTFKQARHGLSLLAGAALCLIVSLILLRSILIWSSVRLTLTSQRLSYSAGVISKKSRETPLSKITEISVSQGLMGRILNFGDLIVTSEGEHGSACFPNLPGADKLKNEIISQITLAEKRGNHLRLREIANIVAEEVAISQPTVKLEPLPPERPPLYSEIVDQIERLAKLKEKGTITEEEFQTAKQELLSRIGKEGNDS